MRSLRTLLLFPLFAACSTDVGSKGESPDGLEPTSEEEVEDYVTNGPIDLAPGSTLGGAELLTEDDLQSPSWSDVVDIPADILDGDDDALSELTCAGGEWLTMVAGVWTCTARMPPERIDPVTSSDGDVLVNSGGVATWVPMETLVPAPGCPSGMVQTGDTCIEPTVRTALKWQSAVVDCANDGLHLCFHAELVPGCLAGTTDPAPTNLEWTSDRTDNGHAAMAFGPSYDCEATTESIGNVREYRCCTGAR